MELTVDYSLLSELVADKLRTVAPQWLAPKDAAVYLSVRPKTLEEWRRLGIGPAYSKLGKHVRYSVKDLEEWARGLTLEAKEADGNQG